MRIDIKGTICSNDNKWIYDFFKMETTSPKDVASAIAEAKKGENIDVYINSGGGEVFAASEIFSALRSAKNVKIHVTGLAASAASVIMCAGHSDIAPTAMVMIHNVLGYADGNYQDFEHEAEVLKTASASIRAAYEEKTGLSGEELQALMDEEKWFTAQEAVNMGLCDEIAQPDNMQLVASAALSPVIPAQVIAAMKAKRETQKQAAFAKLAELEAKTYE